MSSRAAVAVSDDEKRGLLDQAEVGSSGLSMLGVSMPMMSLEEELYLSFLEKWRFYNRFPWKLLVHVLLAFATAVLVLYVINNEAPYMRNSEATLAKMFFPDDYDPGLLGYGRDPYSLYRVDEALALINSSISNYYTWPEQSIDVMTYPNGAPEPVEVVVDRYTGFETDNDYFDLGRLARTKIQSSSIMISPQDMGPFVPEKFAAFVRAVSTMTFRYRLRTIDLDWVRAYDWYVDMTYDFTGRGGSIMLSFEYAVETVDELVSVSRLYHFAIAMNIIVLVLSSWSLLLAAKAVVNGSRLKSEWMRRSRAQRDSLGANPTFFSKWFIVTIPGNLASLFGSIGHLQEIYGVTRTPLVSTLVGVGTMFAWMNLLRYLDTFPKFYLLVTVVEQAMPMVGRFMLGVAPVLIGYALCGMALFANYTELFATFDASMATLFAVLNGDVMLDTFTAVYAGGAVISRIYMYSFICVFIYAVLNIFITIVERGFKAAHRIMKAHDKAHAAALHSGGHDDLVSLAGRESVLTPGATAAMRRQISSASLSGSKAAVGKAEAGAGGRSSDWPLPRPRYAGDNDNGTEIGNNDNDDDNVDIDDDVVSAAQLAAQQRSRGRGGRDGAGHGAVGGNGSDDDDDDDDDDGDGDDDGDDDDDGRRGGGDSDSMVAAMVQQRARRRHNRTTGRPPVVTTSIIPQVSPAPSVGTSRRGSVTGLGRSASTPTIKLQQRELALRLSSFAPLLPGDPRLELVRCIEGDVRDYLARTDSLNRVDLCDVLHELLVRRIADFPISNSPAQAATLVNGNGRHRGSSTGGDEEGGDEEGGDVGGGIDDASDDSGSPADDSRVDPSM